MLHHESNKGEELLEMAVQQLKQQSIPEFTNPSVTFPVTHASESLTVGYETRRRNSNRANYLTRRWAVSAVVLFVACVGGFSLLPWASSSQRAFAQMQEAVRGLKTVVFDMTTLEGDDVTSKSTISYTQSGNTRMESGLVSHVLNANREEYMVVDDDKRTARIEPVYNLKAMQEQSTGVFGSLLKLQPLTSTTVRTVIIAGKPMSEFKTVWDGSVATVTVDRDTSLPVSIELDRGKSAGDKPLREIVSNFRFNTGLEDSMFAIVPPKGYRVDRVEKHEPIASSGDLVLSPSEGVGRIRFGMSLQEVRNHLGDPDSFESTQAMAPELDEKGQPTLPMKWVPAVPPYRIGKMEYRSLGLQIDVSSIDGVAWIRGYEKRGAWNHFTGRTVQGITIGMSKEEIQSLIAPEEWLKKHWKPQEDIWQFPGMDLHFIQEKCVAIMIHHHP